MAANVSPQGHTFLTTGVLFQSERSSLSGDVSTTMEDTTMKMLLLSFLMTAIVMVSYFAVPARPLENKAAD